jgi:carbamoyltransferase
MEELVSQTADSRSRTVDLTVGLAGAERHSCVALCFADQVLAVCPQERVTRRRGAGPNSTGWPDEALDLLLQRQRLGRENIAHVASAEPFSLVGEWKRSELLHQLGHAAASYLTSACDRAAVVVCDNDFTGTSVWRANRGDLARCDWPSEGYGLMTLYSRCARVLGFSSEEQHFEALARLVPPTHDDTVDNAFGYSDRAFHATPGWEQKLEARRTALAGDSHRLRELASAVQVRLGELLLAFLAEVRQATGETTLCLGGRLFQNTYFVGLVKRSPLFERVFVPVSPDDTGLAVGAALYANGAAPRNVSPFIGPDFTAQEVKETLDNCKLQYDWESESTTIARTVSALNRGALVGWFEGGMEWGPRALGARSILASPFSPYVLDNLNRFLKHRVAWRGYALSGLPGDVSHFFEGPAASPYMESDFAVRDPERFRHVLPTATATVRLQTVDSTAPPRFRMLLKAFSDTTGAAVLVNTSFNGFQEPIVCSPRDAVRVYYGTGLDMLVADRFVLTK